ncbi:MAG: hypothetical protein JSV99_11255 [Planctomycetota bacterium]|nr:MAG: hypothetical protein JSV99_11255 [Planctomycetota bacterium]
MNRRERLMASLRGEPVDRPAVNFYEIGGFKVDPSDTDPFNVYNDPSWQPLLQLAEQQTDLIRLRSPVRLRSFDVENLAGRSGADTCRSEFFKTEQYVEDGCRFNRVSLKIGDRTMTSLTRRDPDADTVWTLEHLLKSTDDLKAYLELPDEVFTENIDIGKLIKEDKELGDSGILMVDTEDPICAAASLFSMEDFTIIAITEHQLMHSLLEKLSRYIYTRTEKVAKEFPGHLWRIYGPEYATEPFLPPNLFKEYVVRYDTSMIEAIQRYGGFARIHCHGRTRAVLDYIIEMGADAIDPIEPPPQGDVEIEYVRREYGKNLVLFGNLEISDIEGAELAEFEKIVVRTLKDGTAGQGRGFVLMPSSSPFGREITSKTLANYNSMVRLAINYSL